MAQRSSGRCTVMRAQVKRVRAQEERRERWGVWKREETVIQPQQAEKHLPHCLQALRRSHPMEHLHLPRQAQRPSRQLQRYRQ